MILRAQPFNLDFELNTRRRIINVRRGNSSISHEIQSVLFSCHIIIFIPEQRIQSTNIGESHCYDQTEDCIPDTGFRASNLIPRFP